MVMWCSGFDFGLISRPVAAPASAATSWGSQSSRQRRRSSDAVCVPTRTNITIVSRSPRVERLCRMPSPAFI